MSWFHKHRQTLITVLSTQPQHAICNLVLITLAINFVVQATKADCCVHGVFRLPTVIKLLGSNMMDACKA